MEKRVLTKSSNGTDSLQLGRPFEETVAAVRELGGVAAVPHPFQRSRHGVRNRRARAFARRHEYTKLGASDVHYLPNVGRAYTEITIDRATTAADIDCDTVIDALSEGATRIQGKRTPIHKSTQQYAKGAVRTSSYLVTSRMPVVPTVPASMER